MKSACRYWCVRRLEFWLALSPRRSDLPSTNQETTSGDMRMRERDGYLFTRLRAL